MARIILGQGWYLITYGLGIYILNLFLAFLTPKVDPVTQQSEDDDDGGLPTSSQEEFRPFIRRLPEFKFWYSMSKVSRPVNARTISAHLLFSLSFSVCLSLCFCPSLVSFSLLFRRE